VDRAVRRQGGLSQSDPLEVLQDAGLVVSRKEGRDVRFRLRAEPLTAAMEWMAALAARWDERLEARSRLVR